MRFPRLRWYLDRASAMSPREVSWRAADTLRRMAWRRRRVALGRPLTLPRDTIANVGFAALLPAGTALHVSVPARLALVRAADELLAGRSELLGVVRTDMSDPMWFHDPSTGVVCEPNRYAFSIDFKDEAKSGNAKQIWEISRLQHLTVLAAAYYLTGDAKYAEAVARQLTSWWEANPFLSGVNWTCGIEVGIRLISWVWIRRLIAEWPGAPGLFEQNPTAIRQVAWHQEYLAAFRSRGSSANNHVIAEAAGQLVGACAFPWFARSTRWRNDAIKLFEAELEQNTFPSGINRELAFEYQGFVAELAVVAAVEATASGHPLTSSTWSRIAAMFDSAAAVLDRDRRAPRQGDGDEGRGLVIDDPLADRWPALLGVGAATVGQLPWWPAGEDSVASVLLASVLPVAPVAIADEPDRRPRQQTGHFADAGITILRTASGDGPEIWCRCDGGPHGFLSIAGHAHADALAVELRYDGVDILADPGTYCYHGQPRWRSYFRSTLGHNTLELAGRDQSTSGGPFLWRRHATTRILEVAIEDTGSQTWAAEHDGYGDLDPPATHSRKVILDPEDGLLRIEDTINGLGDHKIRLAFHLGPLVQAELDGTEVRLEWSGRDGLCNATMWLPENLSWTAHRGESEPILGWYSSQFGKKTPATALVGIGRAKPGGIRLLSSVSFGPQAESDDSDRAGIRSAGMRS